MLMSFPNRSAINHTHDHARVPMESLWIKMTFHDNKSLLLAGAVASQSQCSHSPKQLKLLRLLLNDRIICFLPLKAALPYSANFPGCWEGKNLIPHRKRNHLILSILKLWFSNSAGPPSVETKSCKKGIQSLRVESKNSRSSQGHGHLAW